MVELIEYLPEHAEQIVAEGDTDPSINIGNLPANWATIRKGSPAMTGVADGRIVGCSGLEIWWPGMAEGWCVFVKDIYKYKMGLRLLKNKFYTWMDEYKINRIQAPLRADFEDGKKLAVFLGFECENPNPMKRYHCDDSDALM